jgi:putative ABC transport system permease protein
VTRFVDQTGLFMTLVGLTALLVGGIGAANGVRAWLEARARTIATLRSLGASASLVFAVCFIQVMALALLGTVIGLAAGAALPVLGIVFLRDLLPVVPEVGIYPGPLALAAVFGLLTAGAFVLWPLGRAARIPGAALFRDALLPDHVRPSPWIIAANLLLALALVGLTVAVSPDRRFALWFCGAAALTLTLFRLGGSVLMAVSRRAPRARAPWLRLGLGNLGRPGASTPLMLVSVGLGLSTLATVVLIQGNVRRELADQIPANAPTFFFIDVQNDQVPALEHLVEAQPGASDFHQVPSLRARVVAIKGVPVDKVVVSPDTRFALRGDRGLTYAARPPEGTEIVAGKWWPADYDGPPLVSFDAGLAAGWGVGIGDVIRVNVLGRDIDLRIASLRDIKWRSLSINFFMVASPGLLEHAPHTHIATVRAAEPDVQGKLLRSVTDAMPNVTGILVADVLRAVASLLDKIAAALMATGSLTLAAGALVLAGALAAGQRRRTHEAVILKTLGATSRQIRAAWLVEFGILGATAGVIAAAVGAAASWGVMRFLMDAPWSLLPGTLAGTILACIALMLAFGYTGTAAALRAKAAPLLRNE